MLSPTSQVNAPKAQTASLGYLLSQFEKIGVFQPGMKLTLDQTFTGSAELQTMFEACFSTDVIELVVDSWNKAEDSSRLILSGTADILNIEKMGLNITAAELNDKLHLTIELTPPRAATFATCFPDMPLEKTGTLADEEPGGMTPFLDKLSFGFRKFVFTNQACRYGPDQESLTAGLNLVGELYFTGVLYELSVLTGTEGPFAISGPVIEYRTARSPLDFMGVRLTRAVELGPKQFPIEVKNPRIYIKSPLYRGQVDHSVSYMRQAGLYLLAEMDFFGQPWQMVGRSTTSGGETQLAFNGRMTGSTLSGLASLTSNMDGLNLQKQLPAQLPEPGEISLNEIGCHFNLTKKSVGSLSFGVGLNIEWPLIEDVLKLEEVAAYFIVQNPFDKGSRKLIATLSAALKVKDTDILGSATLPSYNFTGALAPGDVLPLADLVESFGKGHCDLPDLKIDQLFAMASPKEKTFAFQCRISDAVSIPVGETAFSVDNIGFVMQRDKTEGVTGAFSANMLVAGACAVLSAELDNRLTLSGSLYRVDLKTFWSQVCPGETLPDELPDIQFDYLTATVVPKEGDFSLAGKGRVQWDKLPFSGALDTQVEFSFSVDKNKGAKTAINARLSLTGTGPMAFSESFDLNSFNFIFEYHTQSGWKLSGGADVTLFDTRLSLQAGYVSKAQARIFTLTSIAKPEKQLLSIDGAASYSFRQFDLMIDRRSVEGRQDLTFWSLRLDSTLAIEHLADIDGYLNLYDKEDGSKGLTFNPKTGSAEAGVDLPGDVKMTLNLFEIGVVEESVGSGWSFSATVDLTLNGGPDWLERILPNRLHGKLMVGKKTTRLSALRVTDPVRIELPETGGKPMGALVFQLLELGIDVRPSAGLTLTTGMGFTQEVNDFLGAGNLFRVYRENDFNSLAKTRITLSTAGIEADILTSPFAGANAVEINGESWMDLDLGECGALRFKLPTFKYDAVTQYFEAGTGAEVTRTLALPLTPFKKLLEALRLKAAADVFPDKLPVKRVKIVDDKGDFKVDELIELLEQAGSVPAEVKDVLRDVANLLDHFPHRFKDYFNIEIPEKLTVKFGFSPTGRVTLDLRTGATPIRCLNTGIVQGVIPMPGLMGIEIRRISIGTIASGSLFQATVDGHIDTYDVGTLAASLVLPTDKNFPLPTSDQLQRRVILNNLFMIIPLQQGVPIPVPVFFDQLGVEYLGIEGVNLQGHAAFPEPDLTGSGAVSFFKAFGDFFGKRAYLLDPKTPPGDIDLVLSLNNNYVQLPEYLGGKVLGMKNAPVQLGLWQYLAHGLNFFKTLSLNEMIQAIPLEHRVGSAQQRFLFMQFDADWLITTPNEFKQGAFEKLNLSASDREDFIGVLPAVQSAARSVKGAEEEGLVVFLRGEADIKIIHLETVFGLAASASMGFSTGFKLAGTLAGMIETEIGGVIAIDAPSIDTARQLKKMAAPALQLSGHTHLKLLEHAIFKGDIRVVDKDFWFKGILALFPSDWPIAVSGEVEGSLGENRFLVTGDVDTELFSLPLLSTHIRISDEGVFIHGQLFDAHLVLKVFKQEKSLCLQGGVSYEQHVTLNFGAIHIGNVKVADNVRIDVDIDLALAVDINREKISLGVKTAFEVNGTNFDLSFTLHVAPSDLAQVLKQVVDKIVAEPMKYLKGLFTDAEKWLQDIGKGVIEFADDTGEALGKALKALDAAEDHVAGLLNSAGYDAEKIGKAMAAGFDKSAEDMAKALRSVGKTAEDTGRALRHVFNADADDAARLLKGAGFPAGDVGKALQQAFTRDAKAAARAMRQAGYAFEDIGEGVAAGFSQNAGSVAKTLKSIGASADSVGKALKNSFGKSPEKAAKLLKKAGFSANDVGKALKSSFTKNTATAARALKSAGFSANDVGEALKGTFSNSATTVGKALQSAGYGADQIGKVMRTKFNRSAKDVANFMKNTLKLDDKAVNSVLSGAGYAANQIDDAMGDVFGWAKDAGKTVKKIAKKVFDPSKW